MPNTLNYCNPEYLKIWIMISRISSDVIKFRAGEKGERIDAEGQGFFTRERIRRYS